MTLRPEDIPRPGVARPRGVSARPTTVALPKIVQPQAGAISDVAAATRRKASEVDRLAQRRRQAGREIAGVTSELARARLESDQAKAAQFELYGKVVGNLAASLKALHEQREEAQDKAFINRARLERAKTFTLLEQEAANNPGTDGEAFVNDFDARLSTADQEVNTRVAEALGYEISPNGTAALNEDALTARASSIRRAIVSTNNERVKNIVSASSDDILEIAHQAAGDGDLEGGLLKVDNAMEALRGVVPGHEWEARRRAGYEQVYGTIIRGHLARGEVGVAEVLASRLVGFTGETATQNQRHIIDAFKTEGVDPLLGLAISSFETNRTFSTTIKNPISPQHTGLFQMSSSMSRAYLGVDDASEVGGSVQAAGGARFTADHVRGLRRALGSEPTPGEVYLAHLLGFGSGMRVIQADSDTPISKLLPKAVIKANKLKGTAEDVRSWAANVMQTHMQGVLDSGILVGRNLAQDEALLPLNTSVQLYSLVQHHKRALSRDPDVVAERREIAKTGYDLLFADKMSVQWIEANREVLTTSDYRTFLRSLQPGTQRKTEPREYLRLYDVADNDPEAAMDELRDLYSNDQIAKDDFMRLFSLARQNSAPRKPFTSEVRGYIRSQLQPTQRDPRWAQSRQLDALWAFDDWVNANPKASREDVRSQAETIVGDYRKIRYSQGATELPAPRFVSVSRDKITEKELAEAKARTIEAIGNGTLQEPEASEQAAVLRRWEDLLRFRD